jgi:hypothetical protein
LSAFWEGLSEIESTGLVRIVLLQGEEISVPWPGQAKVRGQDNGRLKEGKTRRACLAEGKRK